MQNPEEVEPEMGQGMALLMKGDPYLGTGSHHGGRNPNLVNHQKRKARKRIDHLREVHQRRVGLHLGQEGELRRAIQDPNLQSQSRVILEIVTFERIKKRRNLKRSHVQDRREESQDQEAQVSIQGGRGLRPEAGEDHALKAEDPSVARKGLDLPTREVDPETEDPVRGQKRTDQETGKSRKRFQDLDPNPVRGLERADQNREIDEKSPRTFQDLVQSLQNPKRNPKDQTVKQKLTSSRRIAYRVIDANYVRINAIV